MPFRDFKQTIDIQTAPETQQEFIPVANLQKGRYPIVFALTKDKNEAYVLRGFYKSNSESHWRAFCGCRRNQGPYEGAFMKGHELDAKSKAGYIHEALVVPELNKKLDEFSKNNDRDKINEFIQILNSKSLGDLEGLFEYLDKDSMQKYKNFYNKKNYLNIFASEYRDVTKSVGVVALQEVAEGNKYKNNVAVQRKQFHMIEAMKVFQEETLISNLALVSQVEAKSLGYSDGNGAKFQHDLSQDSYMRLLFKSTLQRDNGNDLQLEDQLIISYALRVHKTLGDDGNVFSYQGYVERVYWKNASINDFGIRADVPSDLSSLVQKPLDYREQIHSDNQGYHIDDSYSSILDFNAEALLNKALTTEIKNGAFFLVILEQQGIIDPQANELKNDELLRDSVSMLYFKSVVFNGQWNSLKNSINLQKSVSIFYQEKITAAFGSTEISFSNCWQQMIGNTDLQKAITASYDYLNSGCFGSETKHGDHGKKQAAKFVVKLMQLDETSKLKIQKEMRNWIKGYGIFGRSSNLGNESRISYCYQSGLLIEPERPFSNIEQTKRQAVKEKMLEV
ncbi:hypothetical protein L3V83_02900 [Thiotrichales bacterium 19X7-9]|nr:hypothetical protein [Thiotrichales bacterium 19X7-9]